MNGSITPLWPSLLPPVCDQLWFTADCPKNEEAELAALEEELEQEKLLLKEQSILLNCTESIPLCLYFTVNSKDCSNLSTFSFEIAGQDYISIERNAEQAEEQDYDETEDDSYMGDAASDDVDEEPPQSPTYTFIA